MSQLPQDPDNSEFIPTLPCFEPTAQPVESLPTRADDLDPPYALFDPIQINHLDGESKYAFGLGIRQVDPYTKWGFEKWFNWSLFDSFALFFNDLTNPAAQDNVFEERDRYELAVIKEQVPEGDVIVQGRVERVSGSQSWSPPQTILVKTTRPGGRDVDPGDGYHSGLEMTIIDFPEGTPLTPENIGSGLTAEIKLYENARRNDLITLSYDGHFVEHRVSDYEAQGLTPIRIFIDRSIVLLGSLKGIVTIRFTVTDVVQNPPDEKTPYSKPYLLPSELDPNLAFAPLFFVNDVETFHVDWDTDSDSVFKVQASVDRIIPAPNPQNRVHVFLAATLADKTTQLFTLPPATDTNSRVVNVFISGSIIEQIVGGQFRVFFEWRKANGDLIKTSGSHTVVVVGTRFTMPPPDITPSQLGQVDPSIDALFHVPFYDPHNPGWREVATLENLLPGGGAITWEDSLLAGAQGGTRTIPAAELKRFDGRGNTYAYYTTYDGVTGQTRKSKKLTIQVGAINAVMPQAELQGRIGNNVDPADVVGDPRVTLTHTDFRDKDEVSWTISGSGLGGSANGTFTINAGTAGRPLVFTVDRKILDLNTGGSLGISYALRRPGPPVVRLFSIPLHLTVGPALQMDLPIIQHATVFPAELNPRAALDGTRVIVKYRPMRSTDSIKVTWHTANGFGSVDQYVQGNSATNEVSVDIDSHTIAQGLAEGGQNIQVQYSFFRGAVPFVSEIVNLRLLPLTGLPTPRIDSVDGAILNVFKLSPTARTRVSPWAFRNKNQLMWLRYTGKIGGSTWIENALIAELVGEDGATNGIQQLTPVDKLRQLDDCSDLTIEFFVSFAESYDMSTALKFGVANFIVQKATGALPHPYIGRASGTGPHVTVEPLALEYDTNVTVSYDSMLPSDEIILSWIFEDGTHYETPQRGLVGLKVVFNLTNAQVLHRSVGSTVQLRYTVSKLGVPGILTSEVQTVVVGAIPIASLPAPLINRLPTDAELDISELTTTLFGSIAKWPLSSEYQRVWFTCSSTGFVDLDVLNGVNISKSEAANGLVNKAVSTVWLQELAHRSILTVKFYVTFNGSMDKTKAVEFKEQRYIIKDNLETFTRYPAIKISTVGQSIDTKHFTVTLSQANNDDYLSLTSSPYPQPAPVQGNLLYAYSARPSLTRPLIITLTAKTRTFNRITLITSCPNLTYPYKNITFNFLDSTGALISQKTIPSSVSFSLIDSDYGGQIRTIQIVTFHMFIIDNITLY